MIYHLVPAHDLKICLDHDFYRPVRLAEDGFVHCAGSPETTVAVANDYFGSLVGQLLVFAIAPDRLTAPLKVEPPAPLATAQGESRFQTATLFPHIYGPVDVAAIAEVAILPKAGEFYAWPSQWCALAEFLENFSATLPESVD